MKIRRLTIADYEAVTELWVKAGLPFKPRGRDSRETLAAQMIANPQFFLGAFEGERLVGAVVLSNDLRKGWINRLAADPEYQRRGVALALIAESEKTLRESGVNIFCVLVENNNAASRKLFEKCGYVEQREILYFSKRDNDAIQLPYEEWRLAFPACALLSSTAKDERRIYFFFASISLMCSSTALSSFLSSSA